VHLNEGNSDTTAIEMIELENPPDSNIYRVKTAFRGGGKYVDVKCEIKK
jgi:hypothetical protein